MNNIFKFLTIIFTLIGLTTARADRGAIIALEDVDLQESAQRALIAFDGLEEILILQTDVQASEMVKIVEFMPLPSKPKVSLAPEECFKTLQETIEKHKLRYVIRYRGKDAEDQMNEESSVKLVVSEQLGPHKVSVVEIRDVEKFIEWTEKFFEENNLGKPKFDGSLRKVVKSYLDENIRFFAFDIITAEKEKKTVQPLVYHFKSQEIYYPLQVTNLYGGAGTIELILISPKDITSQNRIYIMPDSEQSVVEGKITYSFMRSEIAEMNHEELKRIEPSIADLMKGNVPMLRAFKYEGPLVFTMDVKVPVDYAWSDNLVKRFFESLNDGNIERLDTLVTVPFAFDRKEVIEDKKVLMEKFAEVIKKTKGSGISFNNLTITPVEDFKFSDEFSKTFAEKYMNRGGYVVSVISQQEEILFFTRQEHAMYKIAGFSD